MYIHVSLFVFPVIISFMKCEYTSDLPKDDKIKFSLKNLFENSSSTTEMSNNIKLPIKGDDNGKRVYIITPSRLTKLTKSFTHGFDPYFSKDYFEPFERKARPVTLVAFRKNGLAQRFIIKNNADTHMSSAMAELQSPYNDVGHFWEDEPGEV